MSIMDSVGEAIERAGTAEEVRALGAMSAYVERLESVAAAAVELAQAAPRALSRDSGAAGDAWDTLISQLEGVDNDLLSETVVRGAPRQPSGRGGGGGPTGGVEVGVLLSAAAEMQRHLDRVGDEGALVAWAAFLDKLTETLG